MKDREFLENIKNGQMSIEEGLDYLKDFNFKDIDIAKLDFQRKNRRGFPETIFCQGKEDFALVEIFKAFDKRQQSVIGTRASYHQYDLVKNAIPNASYDKTARIISLKYEEMPQIGNIAICTGGTADLFVAEEAALTAEFFGAKVNRFYDVGVSGLHRMLNKIDEIKQNMAYNIYIQMNLRLKGEPQGTFRMVPHRAPPCTPSPLHPQAAPKAGSMNRSLPSASHSW